MSFDNYAPPGMYLWDSWFVKERDLYHMFHLQSERDGQPAARHHNKVSIGLATSEDLIHWQNQGPVLKPSEEEEWDNLALWTGSIIKKDGRFYLFYTGRHKDEIYVQKIGLAVSDDLFYWQKYSGNPILTADPFYYHMENKPGWLGNFPVWRDPYLFQLTDDPKYYMTLSATAKTGNNDYRGCIALAESDNLLDWKILPPVLAPAIYDEMEVTQLIFYQGLYYLFFSTWSRNYEPGFAQLNGAFSGLHCYFAETLTGPYHPVNTNGVVLDNGEALYDVRLLENHGNEFTALGFLNDDQNGEFIGKISRPFTIVIDGDRISAKDLKLNL